MNKRTNDKTRTKVRLPQQHYNTIKLLSSMIGKPIATTLSMIVCDTIDTVLYNDNEISSPNKKRKWSRDDADNIKWNEINITIKTTLYDKILDYIQEAIEKGLKNYSFNEFVIDSIDMQIEDFRNIINNKSKVFIADTRISNTHGATYKNSSQKEQLYSEKVLEKHKLTPPINDFLKNKSKQYGITEGALLTFYATKEINRLLKNEAQSNIFKYEYTEYDEHGI